MVPEAKQVKPDVDPVIAQFRTRRFNGPVTTELLIREGLSPSHPSLLYPFTRISSSSPSSPFPLPPSPSPNQNPGAGYATTEAEKRIHDENDRRNEALFQRAMGGLTISGKKADGKQKPK
jgi:hypothetical protein